MTICHTDSINQQMESVFLHTEHNLNKQTNLSDKWTDAKQTIQLQALIKSKWNQIIFGL